MKPDTGYDAIAGAIEKCYIQHKNATMRA